MQSSNQVSPKPRRVLSVQGAPSCRIGGTVRHLWAGNFRNGNTSQQTQMAGLAPQPHAIGTWAVDGIGSFGPNRGQLN